MVVGEGGACSLQHDRASTITATRPEEKSRGGRGLFLEDEFSGANRGNGGVIDVWGRFGW